MDQPNATTTAPNIMHEADIGSGKRSPKQHDTDSLIDQIGKALPPEAPPPPADKNTASAA